MSDTTLTQQGGNAISKEYRRLLGSLQQAIDNYKNSIAASSLQLEQDIADSRSKLLGKDEFDNFVKRIQNTLVEARRIVGASGWISVIKRVDWEQITRLQADPQSTSLITPATAYLQGGGIPMLGVRQAVEDAESTLVQLQNYLKNFPAPTLLTRMAGGEGSMKSWLILIQDNLVLAQYYADQWDQQAKWLIEQETVTVEHHHQARVTEISREFHSRIDVLRPDIERLEEAIADLSPAWSNSIWEKWMPHENTPLISRLGDLTSGIATALGATAQLKAPIIYAFPGDNSLIIKSSDIKGSLAANSIQSLLLRLLSSTPPGKILFTFIDPIGLGQNAAPFMHLADYDEKLVTGKAWSEPQHIEQRLADLTEHMENVIQKYLRNQYANIEEYNTQAGEVAEPYRVLVVFDFPVNFSEAAARRLVSIAQNGPRCGVYAVVLADTAQPLPYGFNMADLERTSQVIAWDAQKAHFVWQDEDFKDCVLALDTPPDAKLFDHIIKTVGEAAKAAGKVEVPFERIAPPQAEWWKGSSSDGLRLPLGPSGARKTQYLELGKGTAQHTLIAGKTGSGKSTLLHTIIVSLALTYSPEEVELYLIDFKKGVEFKTYANLKMPHARVIAIESEREFGLSVLQGLDAELKRRGDLFRQSAVDSLADFRQKTHQKMPRILLMVDEFQEFFTEDDTTASQSSQILDRLVRQGRAFGIHVLLGSQTLAGAYSLARSTIDQMAVRIALQCSEADSRLILSDDNPAARLLSRPGEAIYNASNGTVEGNNRFQVAWLPDDKRDHYLEQVSLLAQKNEYRPTQPQIIFEGNAPAEVEKNRPLHDLVIAAQPPAPARVLRAWIGDPIAIKEPVAANFRRQSGSNLLMVGQSDEAALGIMAVSLLSLSAQLPLSQGGMSHFYLLDFGAVDGAYAEYFDKLVTHIPHPVKIGRRRHLPDMINELATEVQKRLDVEDSAGKGMAADQIYLFIYGLQRARDLKQDDSFGSFASFGAEPAPPNPAQQFSNILRDGPEVGVHTIVWCDTMTNLARGLDRRAMREFSMRVGFQMSAEDSSNLLDAPVASKLGPYRAYFYSEDEGRMEKFRPYAVPSDGWLEQVKEQLSVRM